MNAIVPLINMNNRSNRRKFVREASNIVEDLELVNASFLHELFDESFPGSYESIYLKYLNQWQEVISVLIQSHKFKSCAIDRMWFSNNYQIQLYA
jgi:hypothetical protein